MNCTDIKEDMLVGERRWLEYRVTPCGTAPAHFIIISATYELKKMSGEHELLTGDCIVDNEEKTIKCLIDATERGSYLITLSWAIADEIFKEKVRIEVC